MSAKSNELAGYKFEFESHGPGGWLNYYYFEGRGKLSFAYELVPPYGRIIAVPTPTEWEDLCEESGAQWAKGRREETLQRLIKFGSEYYMDALLGESQPADVEIGQDYIKITPHGEGLASILLQKIKRILLR